MEKQILELPIYTPTSSLSTFKTFLNMIGDLSSNSCSIMFFDNTLSITYNSSKNEHIVYHIHLINSNLSQERLKCFISKFNFAASFCQSVKIELTEDLDAKDRENYGTDVCAVLRVLFYSTINITDFFSFIDKNTVR